MKGSSRKRIQNNGEKKEWEKMKLETLTNLEELKENLKNLNKQMNDNIS